ncbi:AfsR/SARP family transcriptional regulator [Kitasatospora sp. HPMI-4]|uniref:AfsR/SARP family transcriptional regulator n=1 Tax=Kitasatospora sp. HPMI-4 TaxID=3448443 RepID=UPI003F1B6C09
MNVDGRPVERWRAGKARNLFQYLLVNRGRVVHRDRLHEILWPESAWTPRSSSVKVAMHALRRILDGGGTGMPPAVEILHQDHGYVLHAESIWVDVEEFEAHCADGRAAELRGDHDAATRGYRAALALYGGDFLAVERADWIGEQREWNKSLALQALKYLQEEALCQEDFPSVIALCRRMLEIDIYQEQVYRTLMSVHGELGELGRVKSWYEMCARRMHDDLGVAPSELTRKVFERSLAMGRRPRRLFLNAS